MSNSNIPDLPPYQPDWPSFQVWWQLAKTTIEGEIGAASAAAAAALAAADAATAAATAQATADAAAFTGIVIDPVPDIIIYADIGGVPKSGELTRDVAITASLGSADITTGGAWSLTTTPGITCSIGASTGVLSITALDAIEATIPIAFAYNGRTRNGTVHVVRKDDPPTNSGGSGSTGGTTATTTTLGQTNGTVYDLVNAISATMTVTAGSNGRIDATSPISYKRAGAPPPIGQTRAEGKFQWRVPAGTWADMTTDTNTSYPAVATAGRNDAGGLTVTSHVTGLTSGSSYEVRFAWFRDDISGTADDVYLSSGVITVTGS